MIKWLFSFFIIATVIGCVPKKEPLRKEIEDLIAQKQGDFAFAFKDLDSGKEILINPDESFHAASTMKTPVMMEVFKQAGMGKFSLTDTLLIKNTFKSIVDGSLYSLDPEDDSEQELYNLVGTYKPVYELVYDMIVVSSNLATNIMIELVGAKNVTQSMFELGAKNIRVLRGVEDLKAFESGLSNTTTARDLLIIYKSLANNKFAPEEETGMMIDILLKQKFNGIIPGKLPVEIKVAHKTGSIIGVNHDSGIVFLPDGRKYVLVLLSKNVDDKKNAIEVMATISEMIYLYQVDK